MVVILIQVFSAFGYVQKIAIFEKNGGTQALIQYPGMHYGESNSFVFFYISLYISILSEDTVDLYIYIYIFKSSVLKLQLICKFNLCLNLKHFLLAWSKWSSNKTLQNLAKLYINFEALPMRYPFCSFYSNFNTFMYSGSHSFSK